MKSLNIILIVSLFCLYALGCDTKPKTNQSISNSNEKSNVDTASYRQGKLIFRKFCHECHIAPELPVEGTGAFANLFERLPSQPEQYFIKYIQDSKSLKDSGDQYARSLAEQWKTGYEHNFKDSLLEQSFYDLILYIKEAARVEYK